MPLNSSFKAPLSTLNRKAGTLLKSAVRKRDDLAVNALINVVAALDEFLSSIKYGNNPARRSSRRGGRRTPWAYSRRASRRR